MRTRLGVFLREFGHWEITKNRLLREAVMLLVLRTAPPGFRYGVGAVYFFCSYWMDKYNLLRLFATRAASDSAVGAGIVRSSTGDRLQ